MTRALFVNSGILGLASFHRFLAEMLPEQSRIDGEHLVVSDDLSVGERVFRRAICQRLWVDGTLGLTNLDFSRLRHELHAGVLARRRIDARDARRFDVIHFHRQATAYASLDLMRRVPSIVSIDCTQDCVADAATSRVERASYWPNAWLDGLVFDRAAAIVSTSRWAADALGRRYPRCRTPVHVMPNPVLLGHFDRAWIERRRSRARDGAVPRLLFMGGDFPRKGGYDLLAAWTAGRLHERAVLEIVTNWEMTSALPPGVVLTRNVGHHSAGWSAAWERADAFVMPTRNEAFGLVYQEAAAAGLPAIGTRHNAVPEIIADEESGLLVPVGDVAALTVAIQALVDSAALRERLGANARDRIEQVAAPRAYLDALTTIMLDAAAGRAGDQGSV